MPGMLKGFDARMVAEVARSREADAREQAWRQHQGELARASFARMLGMLQGEAPTREPTEEWMMRQKLRGPGMLRERINEHMIPRRDPMRPPIPMDGSVRG